MQESIRVVPAGSVFQTAPVRKQINWAIFTRILLGYDPEQIWLEVNTSYNALNDAND